ncbi:hypothetical protein Leryth_022984 [Lithospermum erythrorhizon]|nr:hypothetical protein Leryth_022984 [Lithospermum erythrorhizon]
MTLRSTKSGTRVSAPMMEARSDFQHSSWRLLFWRTIGRNGINQGSTSKLQSVNKIQNNKKSP